MMANTPAHRRGPVDGPDVDRLFVLASFTKEASTKGSHECWLQQIERDALVAQEAPSVEDTKANIGDWESWEVVVTKGDVFSLSDV